MVLSSEQRSMNRNSFKKGLMGGTLRLSNLQPTVALAVFYVMLGSFLDGISRVVLTMGVIMPRMHKAGTDPLWFGIFIFIIIVLEMAPVTPPVGFSLFLLQGVTEHQIGHIAKAAFPFFMLMVVLMLMLARYAFPQIITFLPAQMKA